ncbi:MAG TPA: plastocyanin/azurin family copper-binding protein [Tepidisphaeraceae bacterium]|nr:plastocyanin/azurin family copper-binding protein [Tepidisphaeraceae bacterium]
MRILSGLLVVVLFCSSGSAAFSRPLSTPPPTSVAEISSVGPAHVFVLAHAEGSGGSQKAGGDSDHDSGPPRSGWRHFVWWVGHFHPAMTVFPIGLLIAAAIAELFQIVTKAPWLDAAARFCVIVAALAAAITAPLGWAFAQGHGHSWVLETHRWLGTFGAVWLLLLLVVSETARRRGGGWRGLYRAGLFLAVPAVGAIGFFGGAMVYGLHEYDWQPHVSADSSNGKSEGAPSTTPGSSGATPAVTIEMTDDMSFRPANVTAASGATIRWRNSSTDEHTVTGDPKHASDPKDVSLPPGAEPFYSGKIKPGGTFEHKFTVPGTYKYVCVPHEDAGMAGQIVITAAPADSSNPHHDGSEK